MSCRSLGMEQLINIVARLLLICSAWHSHRLTKVMSNLSTIVIKIFVRAAGVEVLLFLVNFIRFARVLVVLVLSGCLLSYPTFLVLRHVKLHALIADIL